MPRRSPGPASGVGRPLEAPEKGWSRLSESRLWAMQRAWFERAGMTAWSEGTVPHQATSNPFIADVYARVILGFLRDCKDAGALPGPERPVHVVELGAGSGRLGFRLLRRLGDLIAASSLGPQPLRYVLTDFNEQSIAAWAANPRLASLAEAGSLDFARFDVERDASLSLAVSGEQLKADGGDAAMVVVANYVFDGLPQDAFVVDKGVLMENQVLVSAPWDEDAGGDDLRSQVGLSWRLRPAGTPYYHDPDWDALLDQYRARLPYAPVLFPCAALAGLDRARRLTGGPMLVLSADKGFCRDEDLLEGRAAPMPAWHGSFSMMVDYQLIGGHVRRIGGGVLHPRHRSHALNVSALLFGAGAAGWPEATLAYRQAVDRFGPDDLLTLREGVEPLYERMGLDEILAFLRLSAWDHRRFLGALPALRRHASTLSDRQRRDLLEVAQAVWADFLPIGEERDLALEAGELLVEAGLEGEALPLLAASAALHGRGDALARAHHAALCHWAAGRPAAARQAVEEALALAPDFPPALALRRRIAAAGDEMAAASLSWTR